MPQTKRKAAPKSKTRETKNPVDFTGDAWTLIKQILEKTVVTVFWESVDSVKKKIKISLKLALTFLMGIAAITTGLVFFIVGISQILDHFLGISPGIGYLLSGLVVLIFGMMVLEKIKKEKMEE